MEFKDYDRITDILMYLSDKITLNFNTILSRADKAGSRNFFHYEVEYGSKYIGVDKNHSIKRNMNFFFTIDNKNYFANSIILRPQDVAILNMLLHQRLIPWFFGKERIFSIIDNKLVITGTYQPLTYAQNEYKFIRFEPIVLEFDGNTFKEGVRVTVNSSTEYADLTIDKFMGFYYILRNTDMYSAACNQVCYVKTPPYGINTFSMSGLGGGVVEDKWGPDEEPEQKSNNPKGNKFLDSTKKKGH